MASLTLVLYRPFGDGPTTTPTLAGGAATLTAAPSAGGLPSGDARVSTGGATLGGLELAARGHLGVLFRAIVLLTPLLLGVA